MHRYIDIHSHILPGVDDGAKDMEQTKRMLSLAYEQGIRWMIATPHYEIGRRNTEVSILMQLLEEVQKEAAELGEDFQISLGNELLYSLDIIEALKCGDALTLAGTRYILVEFLPKVPYPELREGIHRFILEGYIPILAHTERYLCLVKQVDYVEDLIKVGAYIQINMSSIRGGLFKPVTNFCKKLIVREWVHFLGTDAHNMGERAPLANEMISYLKNKYGEALVERLIWDNPKRMLEDKHL